MIGARGFAVPLARHTLVALAAFGFGSLGGPADALAQRYVAFGDSITRGDGDEENRGGYPTRLEAMLDAAGQTATVETSAKGGETTAEGLSRLNTLRGSAGDSLLIMEGTNDIANHVSLETIVANLKAMVKRGHQRGFDTVHMATVVPRGQGSNEFGRVQTPLLCEKIRQGAYSISASQPDPFQVFADVPDYPTALFSDGLHPNADGYQLLAEAFGNQILDRDELAPAPSFVTPVQNATQVPRDTLLEVVLFDNQSGVDFARATLTVNGAPVTTTVSGDPKRAVLRARPGNLAGRPILGVDAFDRATPPNQRRDDLSQFTIEGTEFLRADIDRSGRVDGDDLIVLARAFGTRSGESRFIPAADIDRNDRVDGRDLAILASTFGVSSF